jgi:FKBP-type peptidyl-prolyl cis-trans isomerase
MKILIIFTLMASLVLIGCVQRENSEKTIASKQKINTKSGIDKHNQKNSDKISNKNRPTNCLPLKSADSLNANNEKFSYFMGYDAAINLNRIGVRFDISLFVAGTKDANAGNQSKVPPQEARVIIKDYLVKSRKALNESKKQSSENIEIKKKTSFNNCIRVKNPSSFKTDGEKFSYYMGYDAAKNLNKIGVKLDVSFFAAGVEDGIEGKSSKVSNKEAKSIIQDFMAKSRKKATNIKLSSEDIKKSYANKKEANEFLAKNRLKKGVVTTSSGLQYKILRSGSGAKPNANDRVECHYKGTLLDGTKFDSSYDRKRSSTFGLNRVIKGWQEGIPLMKVGAKFKFWIPGKLAYGNHPRKGGPIGPMSLLIFEVELVSIVKD